MFPDSKKVLAISYRQAEDVFMSKQEWMRHRADVLDQAGSYAIGDERSIVREHSKGCKDCNARRRTLRANRSQRERSDAYRSLGLVKTPYGWE